MLLLLTATLMASTPPSDLVTVAERSGFVRTGRHDEVVTLADAFVRAYPGRVRRIDFGTTPEGRVMVALAASADGVLDAAEARRRSRPVVFAQGGIHSGEIDGKDAGFLLLRELLDGAAGAGALSKVTFLFVPIFNVDGHERFGPNNRPNQVGPAEMGWRTTAQNLNLNRDYMKADAPEMQAMLRLLVEWDPIVMADLHVTDGAEFQPDVAVLVQPTLAGPQELAAAGRRLSEELMSRLSAQGHLPLPYYPSFVSDEDPASGFEHGVMPPRFSHPYWELHERLGVLVETHSWKDYPTRVKATRDVVLDLLELAARDGEAWLKASEAARRANAAGLREVVLVHEKEGDPRTIEFPGYAYRREASAISGGLVTRYDAKTPQAWSVPLWDRVKPKTTASLPEGGWIVAAAQAAWAGEKLRLHGLDVVTLDATVAREQLQVFRATAARSAPDTFEGRTRLEVQGEWAPALEDAPAGSLFVPARQPRARLAAHLLEPLAPDSLVAWGFFNAHFERKEYMEPYVAEQVAEELMTRDPAIRTRFLEALAKNPEFAGSPSRRLDFFYKLHPSWDQLWMAAPVYRTSRAPTSR